MVRLPTREGRSRSFGRSRHSFAKPAGRAALGAALVLATSVPSAGASGAARAAAGPAPAISPLVADGNFATPSAAHDPLIAAGTHISKWVVGGNGVELMSATGQQPPPGTTQSVALGNYNTGFGSITQAVNTTPGWSYLMQWYQAGAAPGCGTAIRAVRVSWSGAVVATRTFDSAGHTSTKMGWARRRAVVTATKTTTTLEFSDATSVFAHGCAPANASTIGEVSLFGDAVLKMPSSITLAPRAKLLALVNTAAGSPLNDPALRVELDGGVKVASYLPPEMEELASAKIVNGQVALQLHLPASMAGKTVHASATLSGPNYLTVTHKLTIKVS